MGFWSKLRNSLHKSFELKRISRTLGHQFEIARWASQIQEMKEAEEALFDLIENDEMLSEIMRRHGASRDDLRTLYTALCVNAGEWHRGHWVPASALAFGLPLDYLLAECVSGTRTSKQKTRDEIYGQRMNALFKMREYFEKGRVGRVR